MMSGRELIEVGGSPERISEIVQDLSGFKQIHEDSLTIERKIGEVYPLLPSLPSLPSKQSHNYINVLSIFFMSLVGFQTREYFLPCSLCLCFIILLFFSHSLVTGRIWAGL
jgi:hypothetical protein